MKFLLRGENQNPDVGEVPVLAHVPGVRCDQIALRMEDVRRLYMAMDSGSEAHIVMVRETFGDWLRRFVP